MRMSFDLHRPLSELMELSSEELTLYQAWYELRDGPRKNIAEMLCGDGDRIPHRRAAKDDRAA